jgi:hypothetical protein
MAPGLIWRRPDVNGGTVVPGNKGKIAPLAQAVSVDITPVARPFKFAEEP